MVWLGWCRAGLPPRSGLFASCHSAGLLSGLGGVGGWGGTDWLAGGTDANLLTTDPCHCQPRGSPPQPPRLPLAPSQTPGASPGPPPTKLTLLGWAPPPCPAYPLPCPLGPPACSAAGVTRRCRGSRGSPTEIDRRLEDVWLGFGSVEAEAGRSEGAPPTWSPYQVGFTPVPTPPSFPPFDPILGAAGVASGSRGWEKGWAGGRGGRDPTTHHLAS